MVSWTNELTLVMMTIVIAHALGWSKSLVALGVQGPAESLEYWRSQLPNIEGNNRIRMFLLSYDRPLMGDPAEHVRNFTLIRSTWTSGRNELGKRMFSYEVEIGQTFRYWVFSDDDSIKDMQCPTPEAGDMGNRPLGVYCMGRFLSVLLDQRYAWAQVAAKRWTKVTKADSSFDRADCTDANVVGINRAAVPVLFPYVQKVDRISWWESQAVVFHVASGCIPNGTVTSNFTFGNGSGRHGEYPRGLNASLRCQALNAVYGSRGLCSQPLLCNCSYQLKQGDCYSTFHPSSSTQIWPVPGVEIINKSFPLLHFEREIFHSMHDGVFSEGSATWFKTQEFRRCLSSLRDRFISFVHKHIALEIIDGPEYAGIPLRTSWH